MFFLGAFLETQVNRNRQNTHLFFFPWFSCPQIYYIASLAICFSMLHPFHRIDFQLFTPFWYIPDSSFLPIFLLLSSHLASHTILHLMQTFACLLGSVLWQLWGSGQGPHPCQLMTNKPCSTLAAPHPPQHLLPPKLLTQSQRLQNQRKDKRGATVRRGQWCQ